MAAPENSCTFVLLLSRHVHSHTYTRMCVHIPTCALAHIPTWGLCSHTSPRMSPLTRKCPHARHWQDNYKANFCDLEELIVCYILLYYYIVYILYIKVWNACHRSCMISFITYYISILGENTSIIRNTPNTGEIHGLYKDPPSSIRLSTHLRCVEVFIENLWLTHLIDTFDRHVCSYGNWAE